MPHAETSNPKIFFWTPKVSVAWVGTFVFIWIFVLSSKKVIQHCIHSPSGHIRLTDFGLAKESMGAGAVTHTFCGTPE
jgi:hypothetical protein